MKNKLFYVSFCLILIFFMTVLTPVFAETIETDNVLEDNELSEHITDYYQFEYDSGQWEVNVVEQDFPIIDMVMLDLPVATGNAHIMVQETPFTRNSYHDVSLEEFEMVFDDYELHKSSEVEGDFFHEFVYHAKMEGMPLKFRQLYEVLEREGQNNLVILFTYSSLEENFNDYVEEIETVIDSIQIFNLEEVN